jgi:hypothetical protein
MDAQARLRGASAALRGNAKETRSLADKLPQLKNDAELYGQRLNCWINWKSALLATSRSMSTSAAQLRVCAHCGPDTSDIVRQRVSIGSKSAAGPTSRGMSPSARSSRFCAYCWAIAEVPYDR